MAGKDRYLTIRASETEVQMAHALAEREGQTTSEFLRFVIRRMHADAFGHTKPKAKPKTRKKEHTR